MYRVVRLTILSLIALAAVLGPSLAGGADGVVAQCRAAFGSLNDGICLDGPSAPAPDAPSFGIPAIGIGPTPNGNGPGITTSPLLPGETIQFPIA